jgi:Rps23 Pro-64 3,4-dihydroxylase Tpa1-like proline 4-hydroxylase
MRQSHHLTKKTQGRKKPLYLTLDASSINSRHLYESVLKIKSSFGNSAVTDEHYNVVIDKKRRQSLSLLDQKAVRALSEPLGKIVADNHLEIVRYLQIKSFRHVKTKCSCVVFQDGDFFEKHRDYVPYAVNLRRYTWVYYYHREPRCFSGGNLLFFEDEKLIEEVSPSAGTLIVFAADIMHAVSTVRVPSGDFADGRFSLNGFVSERPSVAYRLYSKTIRTLKRIC